MSDRKQNLLLAVPEGPLLISPQSSVAYSNLGSLQFSLVIPTFNEGRNIQKIISILSGILDRVIPEDYELIVVDDDSPDRTWELACELIPEYPQLRVMQRETERGLSTAVIRGFYGATQCDYRQTFEPGRLQSFN